MTAVNDLTLRERDGESYAYPVLANVKLFGRGATGLTAAGFAVPAAHGSCVVLVGLAEERTDNTGGANGDKIVNIKKGVWNIPLSATAANIKAPVYASADDTFTLSSAGGVLQIGTVDAVDADGTWLKIS